MTITKLLDLQFKMEGIDYDYSRMANTGIVYYTEKKKEKSDYWYNLYFFSNQANYEKWKEECLKHIDLKTFNDIDLKYGMAYKYI